MPSFDVAIVGGGIMGLTTACELERAGASVALVDQAALPNPAGASVDHSKVFRFAYPEPLYAKLAAESLQLWRALEDETSMPLLTRTGVLMIGREEAGPEQRVFDALRSLELDAELWTNVEAAANFPQFNAEAFGCAVFDPNGGLLRAERAVEATASLARRRGVTLFETRPVTRVLPEDSEIVIDVEGGERISCEKTVIAAGPWTWKLFPMLASTLRTTRQDIVYFKPRRDSSSFDIGRFPIFIELESGFYGFPIHHQGAMKLANHNKGETVDPSNFDDEVPDDFIAKCRSFFSKFIPALSDSEVQSEKVCLYNNTPDDDFILDWYPDSENILIVSGFSGHGFKFAPVIGSIAAELLVSGSTSHAIDRFKLSRFESRGL